MWNVDVKGRMLPAHGIMPKKCERYYWEFSLMCHLLDGLAYGEMKKKSIWEVMDHFNGRFGLVPGDEFDSAATTTDQVDQAITRLLQTTELKDFKFSELYFSNSSFTTDQNHQSNWNALKTCLNSINNAIHQDTYSQGRFYDDDNQTIVGCELCIPFYKWQEDYTTDPQHPTFPETKYVANFFRNLGRFTLRDLLDHRGNNPHNPGNQVPGHVRSAKSHKILSSSRIMTPSSGKELEGLTIEFNNDLVCSGTYCVPGSGFCLTSSDGHCSAMNG